MGKGKISEGGGSITEDDFKKVAQKWGMSLEQTKRNILDLLTSLSSKSKSSPL